MAREKLDEVYRKTQRVDITSRRSPFMRAYTLGMRCKDTGSVTERALLVTYTTLPVSRVLNCATRQ